ncbi:MAG TPA: SRPBCC domain-containing protein, partial [Micromonosporaceae bacterium]
MSEVRLDFAYPVPPDRLWQALTDRTQLAVWFMENDFAPEPGRRFLLWPNQVDLIDGPINGVVLEVVPARRLVLGWQAGGMHSTVTWQLTPAGYGTRLRVNQSGVLGSAERVRELGTQYRRLFGERLFALVCAGGVGFTGGDGRAGSAGGNATGAEQMGRPPQRFRRWAAVAAVVILAIAGLVWLSRPERAWLGGARAGPGVVGVGPAPTVSAGASAWPGTGAGTGPGVPSPTQPGTSATATPAPPQTAA